jgi:hypothetical protein
VSLISRPSTDACREMTLHQRYANKLKVSPLLYSTPLGFLDLLALHLLFAQHDISLRRPGRTFATARGWIERSTIQPIHLNPLAILSMKGASNPCAAVDIRTSCSQPWSHFGTTGTVLNLTTCSSLPSTQRVSIGCLEGDRIRI